MLNAPRTSQVSDDLDMVRGIAAFCVFLGHGRNLFLVDYAQVASQSLPLKLFYFVTGLGHEWVMVFFVLSGFFISSSVLKDIKQSSWSWSKYLNSRCSRLYIVLIPALLLTVFWDELGMALSKNAAIYQGIGDQNVIPNVSDRTNIGVFAGNSLFLQTVFVPCLGSNGPLWSLANEFWYYMVFPCLVLLLTPKYPRWNKGACAAILLVITVAGQDLMHLFTVWLMGAGLTVMPRCNMLFNPVLRRIGLTLVAILCMASLVAAKMHFFQSGLLADCLVGLTFALAMYVVLHNSNQSLKGWYSLCATGLAGMSYTLYLTHLPLLIFILVLFGPANRWQPDVDHLASLVGFCLLVFVYAYAISRLTEARTNQIRRFIGDVFSFPGTKARLNKINSLPGNVRQD